jgi:hypothetical protein
MVNATKRYLLSQHREAMNKMNGPVNAVVEDITLLNPLNSLQAGCYIGVDLEIMYVWSVDGIARTASVARGQLGSVATTHADGAMVTINPKFPDFSVVEALNTALDEMSGRGLYGTFTGSYVASGGVYGYDLNTPLYVLDQLDARYDESGPANTWPRVNNWHIRRDSNVTEFPSGYAIVLEDTVPSGRPFQVTFAYAFTHITNLADNTTTLGLSSTMTDIPPLGAALRLQGVREGQRNFNESQPEPRRQTEVPAGAQLTSTRGLGDFFNSRITTELRRLNRLYPQRRRIA